MMLKNNIWKYVLLIVIVLTFLLNYSVQADVIYTAKNCEEIMEDLQQLLEEEPKLPDEIYTGIMFIKMDAIVDLENGEYQSCLEKLGIISRLLNVDKNINYQFPIELKDNGAENSEF